MKRTLSFISTGLYVILMILLTFNLANTAFSATNPSSNDDFEPASCEILAESLKVSMMAMSMGISPKQLKEAANKIINDTEFPDNYNVEENRNGLYDIIDLGVRLLGNTTPNQASVKYLKKCKEDEKLR